MFQVMLRAKSDKAPYQIRAEMEIALTDELTQAVGLADAYNAGAFTTTREYQILKMTYGDHVTFDVVYRAAVLY